MLMGKTDNNRSVIFEKVPLFNKLDGTTRIAQPGDYVTVDIEGVRGLTLIGKPLHITDIVTHHNESTTKKKSENDREMTSTA